jgi:hypothetical protein
MTGWLLAAFVSLQAADVTSTCYVLHTGRYREMNPFFSRCAAIAPVKAAMTAGVVYAGSRLPNKAQRKWVWIAGAAASAYPVIHNMKTLK